MIDDARSGDLLHPDAIAAAAIGIIDRDGPDALSFRALATALGVSHMTVHRRVGDLAGLLDMCVDHVAQHIPAPDCDLTWVDYTEQLFTGLYDTMVRHPGLVALRRGKPWLGPRILERLVEPALQANLAAGMTPQQMIGAYRRMYLFTLGCAAFVDHADPRAAVTRTRTALAALDPADYPALTRHTETILQAVVDHEVYRGGLRQLIQAAAPRQ